MSGNHPDAVRLTGWRRELRALLVVGLFVSIGIVAFRDANDRRGAAPPDRREVLFWHFWGGKERPVVEEIVARFNASQTEHFVRAVAMPGNNLDLKFFLSVAGGDPPDVLNQDDPIVADWASRGALAPLDELAQPNETAKLNQWLFPAARSIGLYHGRMYALCNGLDVRALYYNQDILDQHGLQPPRTTDELDHIAETITPPGSSTPIERYGYLPDPRRIWAWGAVFGGRFYDATRDEVTADEDGVVRALDWMAGYSRRYGPEQVVRFRKGDQALPGAAFPLLQGRYALLMDGQWRVAEIAAAQEVQRRRGREPTRYGAVPLPTPPSGRQRAGWVNGNFFVVPRGAKNPQGAWAFMKFWSGFGGHEAEAARACAAGGWIPASPSVARQPAFQAHLKANPMLTTFVELAGSPNQLPTPTIPGAQYFQDEIIRAAEDAVYKLTPASVALQAAADRVRARLRESRTREANDAQP